MKKKRQLKIWEIFLDKKKKLKQLKTEYEEGENYCKPVRVSNFWSNNYIESKSNEDRNKTLSVKKYLYKIRPYLKNIIINLKKFDTRKIQLTIANNFLSSIDKMMRKWWYRNHD